MIECLNDSFPKAFLRARCAIYSRKLFIFFVKFHHFIFTQTMDKQTLFKISYGLFVLCAEENGKDNGCVINTLAQVTDEPCRVTVTVNKANLTHDMILRTGKFNVSILAENASFLTFQRFGFQSGRNAMKFYGTNAPRAENGILYWTEGANAFLSGEVISSQDLGSHTLFIAQVTEARVLDPALPSATYAYYHENIKPKPAPVATADDGKFRFRCRICGHIHVTDTPDLPDDFICPLCKHGKDDFERI
ncbi:MAG: flavin reductase [Thermoguttaceae bacterium]|nr:flavin reductase [Thermoguttaceae bacterium]